MSGGSPPGSVGDRALDACRVPALRGRQGRAAPRLLFGVEDEVLVADRVVRYCEFERTQEEQSHLATLARTAS